MNYEEARDILLKKFDKLCGNYLYQNAEKIDYEQALYDGAQALEKQIPKKPIKAKEHIMYSMCYVCPNCQKSFSGTGIASYCYHCGQALDWSGEE